MISNSLYVNIYLVARLRFLALMITKHKREQLSFTGASVLDYKI